LQHPGLVALLDGLLRASFADGNGINGVGEERKAGAQAKGRRGGEEEAELEARPCERLEPGRDRSCWCVFFPEGSFLCEEFWEADRVRGMGLAHSCEMLPGYPYRWKDVRASITSTLLI
jgi:hypothetical protein